MNTLPETIEQDHTQDRPVLEYRRGSVGDVRFIDPSNPIDPTNRRGNTLVPTGTVSGNVMNYIKSYETLRNGNKAHMIPFDPDMFRHVYGDYYGAYTNGKLDLGRAKILDFIYDLPDQIKKGEAVVSILQQAAEEGVDPQALIDAEIKNVEGDASMTDAEKRVAAETLRAVAIGVMRTLQDLHYSIQHRTSRVDAWGRSTPTNPTEWSRLATNGAAVAQQRVGAYTEQLAVSRG